MRFKLFSILLILCVGTLIYSNSYLCSFHFDDFRFITQNLAIRDIHDLQGIWHYFHGRFITFFSLAFNYYFNGLDVFGYHLFNLAVHLGAAILVWWLTLLTFSTPAVKEERIAQHANIIALFTGLVFVSHPVQIEAVTYIWQRAASMVALFYLASVCLYVKSRLLVLKGDPVGYHYIYYVLSLIMAVVAMFTKENAVTLPLMILIYELTFLKTQERFDWKGIAPFLLTIFIIPITFLFIKTQAFDHMHGNLKVYGSLMTPMHYFVTQFRVMITYIRLVFFPFNQNLDYDYPVFKSIFELPVLTGIVFLIAIFYFTKRLFSKYRLISFSILWFFLTLTIPESSFWAMGDVIAEHRLYLPMVGYSIFLVSGAYYILGKNSFKWAAMALIVIITGYSFLTFQRNKVWKDEVSLWQDAVVKSPHKARPYNNRGNAYVQRGDLPKAMSDFNRAIEINPNYGDAYSNRGAGYLYEGKYTQAISDYNRSIELNPKFTRAYLGRAQAYYFLKEYDKSWSDVRKIEEIGNLFDYESIYMLVRALSDAGPSSQH